MLADIEEMAAFLRQLLRDAEAGDGLIVFDDDKKDEIRELLGEVDDG